MRKTCSSILLPLIGILRRNVLPSKVKVIAAARRKNSKKSTAGCNCQSPKRFRKIC